MTFVVGVDGSLSNISAHDCKIERFNTTKFSQETESRQKELKKQFALLFAKEGARVIRKMPKWTPGTLNGKAVRIKFDLRISFIDPNVLLTQISEHQKILVPLHLINETDKSEFKT